MLAPFLIRVQAGRMKKARSIGRAFALYFCVA